MTCIHQVQGGDAAHVRAALSGVRADRQDRGHGVPADPRTTLSPTRSDCVLAGRRVLVVGGGTVATRRVPALLDAGAAVALVAPEVTPALHGQHRRRPAQLVGRARFRPADLDDAWLVQVAIDDPAAAAQISAAAEERRVFCVRADDRQAASAWTPAVTRHGPVTVAVIGGGDPRRAMAVRDAVRALLADAAAVGSRGAPVPQRSRPRAAWRWSAPAPATRS